MTAASPVNVNSPGAEDAGAVLTSHEPIRPERTMRNGHRNTTPPPRNPRHTRTGPRHSHSRRMAGPPRVDCPGRVPRGPEHGSRRRDVGPGSVMPGGDVMTVGDLRWQQRAACHGQADLFFGPEVEHPG